MKLSELIREINDLANDTFDQSGHYNDAVWVGMYTSTSGEAQVWLERSSQVQLDLGEIEPSTQKIVIARTGFYTTGYTLFKALLTLRTKVLQANEDDFSA